VILLRLAQLEEPEFTNIKGHFENKRSKKNGIFLLTPYRFDPIRQ
jgi:hypothetical protein